MDKENQQRFFTCERNSDYFFFSWLNFCILVFLLFPYHSFHYPCYYLNIFDFLFHVFIDWLFLTCVFATLAVIGVTLVCGRCGSRVYISKILTCSFCSRFFSDTTYYTWTITGYLAEKYELAEDFYGGEADCKELVNPWWVVRQFFTDGTAPHMAILPGVRPIKVASLGN